MLHLYSLYNFCTIYDVHVIMLMMSTLEKREENQKQNKKRGEGCEVGQAKPGRGSTLKNKLRGLEVRVKITKTRILDKRVDEQNGDRLNDR
jgi:hypothetical protein